jgi:lysophospholipase L1-like esterase
MIGDSYPALSGEIATHLESLATTAGALASGTSYRTYYVSGTNMSGGMPPSIPAQFGEAVSANPDIKYVLMDGGGNDILLGNSACITTQPPPASASCVTTVSDAITAATTLFGQMKSAGVEKVVYYFYPHLPTSGKPYVNDTIDYAYPLVQAACASAPLPCTFIDTRAAFEGHPEYIGPDGIHPTTAGSDVIASLIWSAMQAQCIAQ